jgi:hypothetical protein
VSSQGAEAAQFASPIGPEPNAKTNALRRFPDGGLSLPKESAESRITLEARGVADLLTADPLTRGRAVACQLPTKQRRLLDDVDGAGLQCRRRTLRLRRSNGSCTGLGQFCWRSSSDEANSSEQRNDETHRHLQWSDGTVPPGTEGYLATHCECDESG